MNGINYGMFSKSGNKAVAAILTAAMKLPITTTNEDLYKFLRMRMDRIKEKHPEVWDTEVRECMISILERRLHRELTMYF